MFKRFNQDSAPSPFTRVALVIIEMMLGMVLRFDKRMRQIAYPLAQNTVVVCVRAYLPNIQFYATFCQNGILLDTEAPFNKRLEAHAPDVVVSGSSMALFRALSGQPNEKLNIRGNAEHEALVVKAIQELQSHGFSSSILDHIRSVPFVSMGVTTDADMKRQIKGQAETISELSLALREADFELRKQVRRQRNLAFLSVFFIFCLFAAFVVSWLN